MFKTRLENVDLKRGRGMLLQEALQVFRQLFWDAPAEKVKDKYGIISYKIGECYLVAKKSTYGDIVSVHKKIWNIAKKRGGMIYLYLQSSGYFYRFNPRLNMEIVINERGGIPMVNFDIRHGKNLLKIKAMKRRMKYVVQKNKDRLKKEEEDLILKTALT